MIWKTVGLLLSFSRHRREVAPFESAELEVCWTDEDALQRWHDVSGANRTMAKSRFRNGWADGGVDETQ